MPNLVSLCCSEDALPYFALQESITSVKVVSSYSDTDRVESFICRDATLFSHVHTLKCSFSMTMTRNVAMHLREVCAKLEFFELTTLDCNDFVVSWPSSLLVIFLSCLHLESDKYSCRHRFASVASLPPSRKPRGNSCTDQCKIPSVDPYDQGSCRIPFTLSASHYGMHPSPHDHPDLAKRVSTQLA
jgi:hypothetical protein